MYVIFVAECFIYFEFFFNVYPECFMYFEWTSQGLAISVDINLEGRGAWVAQSVEHPTSAQVMISWFMRSSPRSGLCAVNVEPALDSLPPSLSAPPLLTLSLSQNK